MMKYNRKVLYGAFLVSSSLVLVGISSLLNDNDYLQGTIFLLLGIFLFFSAIEYQNSRRFGAILIALVGAFFFLGLTGDISSVFEGKRHENLVMALVSAAIGIFCFWKSAKMWSAEDMATDIHGRPVDSKHRIDFKRCPSCNIFQNATRIECPNCGYDLTNVPVEKKEKRSLAYSARLLAILLCLGSATTFIIGIALKDLQSFKWGLIGLAAGAWIIFRAHANKSKLQKNNVINTSKTNLTIEKSHSPKSVQVHGDEPQNLRDKDLMLIETIKKCGDEAKLIEFAKINENPDVRLAALEKLINNPIFPELVEKEIERIRGRLQVGMTLSAVNEILGSPTASMGGSEVIAKTKNLGASVPNSLEAHMGGKKFMEWDRPEGRYKLVIEDGKVSKIFSVPESIYIDKKPTTSK